MCGLFFILVASVSSVIDVVIHGFSLVSMVLSVDSTGHDGKRRYKRNLGGKKERIRELRVRNCSDVSLWDDDINTGWRQYFYDGHFFHSSSGLIYQGLNFQRNVAKKSESSAITRKLKQHLISFWRNNWKRFPLHQNDKESCLQCKGAAERIFMWKTKKQT